MNLTSLTAADFKNIVGLMEQKEKLRAEIARIDQQLAAYEGEGPAALAQAKSAPEKPTAPTQPKASKPQRGKRGAVKAKTIALIQGAGKGGITVKDLAAKLGVDYNRVFTWFYNTGKTIKEIKKIRPGKYAWVG